ncbi:hypothetical protein [Candidatus Pelagibacter communis]|jgi:BMFP domain-containing protein YqiC|uniref:hypothetical protein n=1 Tax=Pelagibacter ubique TaxID=198252 RepID=UPI00094D045A|nr:hypothetical protein [Candidatus Pelagibacter ubique]|tara:strand:+ start:2080 stop:2325 length:246 start_codon:yes stop_codon:yes gene_type:complete
MTKSKFVIDKIAKLLEQGLISYKDLSNEILNIIKSKKDEIIFKLDLSTKEELEIVKKRLEILEKKLNKKNKSTKIKKVKKS